MFSKIMSMADSQIEEYCTMLTDLLKEKLNRLKPLNAKKELAFAQYGEKSDFDLLQALELDGWGKVYQDNVAVIYVK